MQETQSIIIVNECGGGFRIASVSSDGEAADDEILSSAKC